MQPRSNVSPAATSRGHLTEPCWVRDPPDTFIEVSVEKSFTLPIGPIRGGHASMSVFSRCCCLDPYR